MKKNFDGISLAERLFNEAFDESRCRDPRSDEYKAGVRAALRFRLAGEKIPSPYKPGTPQDDAYHSGIGEGYMILETLKRKKAQRKHNKNQAEFVSPTPHVQTKQRQARPWTARKKNQRSNAQIHGKAKQTQPNLT